MKRIQHTSWKTGRSLLAAVGVALAAALGAGAGTAAAPKVASAPGLVVEQSGRIYVEGVEVARGNTPVWSPDGRRLAFVREGELFVSDPDGRQVRRLVGRSSQGRFVVLSPSWSPDGATIVFAAAPWGAGAIYTVSVADRTVRRLTHDREPWRGNYTPAYSPDGRLIAFSRSTDAFNTDIFLMRRNGTGLRRLTTSQGTETRLAEEHGPAWSPDGRTIVFVTNRSGKSFELWRIGVDGRGERALTNTPSPRADEDLPRFSPDGRRIVYTHDGRIAVMRADGTGVRELGLGVAADWR